MTFWFIPAFDADFHFFFFIAFAFNREHSVSGSAHQSFDYFHVCLVNLSALNLALRMAKNGRHKKTRFK